MVRTNPDGRMEACTYARTHIRRSAVVTTKSLRKWDRTNQTELLKHDAPNIIGLGYKWFKKHCRKEKLLVMGIF